MTLTCIPPGDPEDNREYTDEYEYLPGNREEVADHIEAAADLIEREGWCQGALTSPEGGYCVEGALMQAPLWYASVTYEAAQRDLTLTLGQLIPRWNDTPGRTKQKVLEMLRLEAERVRTYGLRAGSVLPPRAPVNDDIVA